MNTASCKAKGRTLQKEIVMLLRKRFAFDLHYEDNTVCEDCYSGDITARPMGCSGTDVVLSPQAQQKIVYDIECKAQENLNIWSAMTQCEANTKEGRVSLLVFKRNRTGVYCCLKFDDLLKHERLFSEFK